MRNEKINSTDHGIGFREIPGRKITAAGQRVPAVLFLVLVFLLSPHALFADMEKSDTVNVLPPDTAGKTPASDQSPFNGVKDFPKESPDTLKGRIARRIPSFPFREDEVYQAFLGYGMSLEISLPEKVRSIVPPAEQLVSADYINNKAYFKGIAYAVGESTNVHINLESGKSFHLRVTIVEPWQSDDAMNFIVPQTSVFGGSYVQKEIEKEKKKLEQEIEAREGNLAEVTEKLSEEKIKDKLLRENKSQNRKKRSQKGGLEIRNFQTTRIGDRMYVKLTIRNFSKNNFEIGTTLLDRPVGDPKHPAKVLGFEDVEMDEPTLESKFIPAGGEVKVLFAFNFPEIWGSDKLNLKIIEAGGSGRVAEFKDMKLFSS